MIFTIIISLNDFVNRLIDIRLDAETDDYGLQDQAKFGGKIYALELTKHLQIMG